jgi:hypothetical protein
MQPQQFIGYQLVIGGTLQRNEFNKKTLHLRGPSTPPSSSTGLRYIAVFGLQIVVSKFIKSTTANPQLAGRRNGIESTRIEVLENPANEIGWKSVD